MGRRRSESCGEKVEMQIDGNAVSLSKTRPFGAKQQQRGVYDTKDVAKISAAEPGLYSKGLAAIPRVDAQISRANLTRRSSVFTHRD